MHREISNKRSNQRVQLKNPGCKRIESNKASKVGTRERTTRFRNLKLGQKFHSSKTLRKLVSRNGGFVTKLQAFESPDSDKRARNKTDLKIGSEIESEK